ncbi:MAG TPA: shikimate kinase [Flavobacteriaceae bacterium]|nr:shikimate kinase [Flavobacteriaceae bacterium]
MSGQKIALCGYMGSGKTEVGKRLSEELKLDFVDLDQEISTHEKKSIPLIFQKKGEVYFRKIEHQLLQSLLLKDSAIVLSLGGGTPCYGNNLDLLKQSKVKLVYLKANLTTLTDRLFEQKNTRPLISHYHQKNDLEEFVRKHLFERSFFYLQSDLVVEVDGKSGENIVSEIISDLK